MTENNNLDLDTKARIFKFYEQPAKLQCDDLGLLVFPENSEYIHRCSLLLSALPDAPSFIKLETESDEEARNRRKLVMTRWSVMCCALLLPYCREDVDPNSEEYEDIEYWNALKEDFLQSGGDFPLIISTCSQKLSLLESVGKKFADFPLSAEDLRLLEGCLQERRTINQLRISECSSEKFIHDTLSSQQYTIEKFEKKLDQATHIIWRILTLNIDYIPPLTLRAISRDSKGSVKEKRESIKNHLMSFRLEEYNKYKQGELSYELPRKFSSRSVPQSRG